VFAGKVRNGVRRLEHIKRRWNPLRRVSLLGHNEHTRQAMGQDPFCREGHRQSRFADADEKNALEILEGEWQAARSQFSIPALKKTPNALARVCRMETGVENLESVAAKLRWGTPNSSGATQKIGSCRI
jgi:hypothetical protein